MLASELVKLINKRIAEFGDQPIMVVDSDGNGHTGVNNVSAGSDVLNDNVLYINEV